MFSLPALIMPCMQRVPQQLSARRDAVFGFLDYCFCIAYLTCIPRLRCNNTTDYPMNNFIDIATDGTIRTLTLNRPEKRNALHPDLVGELQDALEQAASDRHVRVLILTGAGSVFCAGADLSYLEQINMNSLLENRDDSTRLMEMFATLCRSPLPVIARVNGHAIAGGCGLALACDIIVASEKARLGFTEVRIGFVPAIVMRLLVQRVGMGRARELLLRGNLLSAVQAHRIGMIDHVQSENELDNAVHELANDIAVNTSQSAVAMTKKLLMNIESLGMNEAMRFGADMNALSRETDDFRKGIASFLDKSPLDWTESD